MLQERTYKITLARQLSELTSLLLFTVIYLGLCQFEIGWSVASLAGLAFVGLFGILPTLAVHIQYLVRNKGIELTINTAEQFLLFKMRDGRSLTYPFSAIKELIRTSSYGRGSWYLFGEYRYYKLVFDDGSEQILTSLLVPQLEQNLVAKLGVEEERELKIVAFI